MDIMFRERLSLLREAQGLTGEALATLAGKGMKSSTISLLEGGKRSNPYASTIARLARALNTSTDYLLGLIDDPSPPLAKFEIDPQLQRVIGAWPRLDVEGQEQVANFVEFLAKRQNR